MNGTFFLGGSTPSPTNQTVSITIDNQVGGSIDGKITLSPAGLSTTLTGTVSPAGVMNVVFQASATVAAGGGFLGNFNGSTLTIPNGTGSLVINSTIGDIYDLGGSLNFSGSSIINPTEAPGTTVKDAGTIQSEVLGVVAPIQTHLVKTMRSDAKGFKLNKQGFLLEGESGINSGDIDIGKLGIWLSYNFRDVENEFAPIAFESTSHTAVGGIDYSPSDNFVLGVALAYENADTDTTFNAGNLESDGFTIAPYVGFLMTDRWSIDATMGWSFIRNDQFRTDPATLARVTSNPDTDRFFMAVNLNSVSYYDNWILGMRFGYLFANSVTEQFTESNGAVVAERRTKLGQFRIGGDIAYSYGNWEPFFSATYQYDHQLEEIVLVSPPQPENDRDDVLLAMGFRYFNSSGFSSNFEYSKRVMREDFDEDSLTLTVRYDF